jgi:hypothetical protein
MCYSRARLFLFLIGIVCAMAAGVLSVIAGQDQQEKGGPAIVVGDIKKGITRDKDQVIDPENPPPGYDPKKEAGFTDCFVKVDCSYEASGKAIKDLGREGCIAEVTVKKVTVTPNLKITVFLPKAPAADASQDEKNNYAVLKAHEEGHAKICREVFEIVAKKIIEDVFKAFPRSFQLTVSACTDAEIKKRQDEALKVLCDGLSKSAEDKIREQLDKVNAAYDSATNNGTTGADGKSAATEKNQNDAASEAVKNEKKDFEKPNK